MSIEKAKQVGLLSHKDLMQRWNVDSVRTIQRHRKRFNLMPVDFTGKNPLFSEADVEAMEARRRNYGLGKLAKAREQNGKGHIGGLLTLQQIKAKARRDHQKGLSK